MRHQVVVVVVVVVVVMVMAAVVASWLAMAPHQPSCERRILCCESVAPIRQKVEDSYLFANKF